MARSAGQKLKLLYIIRLLSEFSDEQHPISTNEIIAHLEANGIHSERKSIYDDIAKLIDFGYDIVQVQSRLGGGYYLAGREFELAELKLLVDAVQSSRFITAKKSRSLIAKLERMAGKHDAGKLQRQVYVAGRVKTENESIYYNIDAIHRAIQENKQISFTYMDWNIQKQMVPRPNGGRIVSPWALIWQDEYYYLIAYKASEGQLKHYRVDKMGAVEILDEKRQGSEVYEQTDLARYTSRTFGMYGGDEEIVSLDFPARLVGVVLDRFGKDAQIRPLPDNKIRVRIKVALSAQFYGWLAGVGPEAAISGPEYVREAYQNYLKRILENS